MNRIEDTGAWEPNCAARHLGLWLVEPMWFRRAVASVQAGTWDPQAAVGGAERRMLYMLDTGGIAHIEIAGPMMKGDSKFGGTNTVRTRRAIRTALADGDVKGLMLHVDSPGGTVAGTSDLALEVRAAADLKPTFAHIDDLGASAAFWTASQASQLSIGKTGEVGSIGVVAVVEDSSKAAEMAGIEVHVISSGEFKGAFADGAPVRPEDLAELQSRIDNVHDFFTRDVAKGRGISLGSVLKAADGRIFPAAAALTMGLVDKVQSFDSAVEDLRKAVKRPIRPRLAKAERQVRLSEA